MRADVIRDCANQGRLDVISHLLWVRTMTFSRYLGFWPKYFIIISLGFLAIMARLRVSDLTRNLDPYL